MQKRKITLLIICGIILSSVLSSCNFPFENLINSKKIYKIPTRVETYDVLSNNTEELNNSYDLFFDFENAKVTYKMDDKVMKEYIMETENNLIKQIYIDDIDKQIDEIGGIRYFYKFNYDNNFVNKEEVKTKYGNEIEDGDVVIKYSIQDNTVTGVFGKDAYAANKYVFDDKSRLTEYNFSSSNQSYNYWYSYDEYGNIISYSVKGNTSNLTDIQYDSDRISSFKFTTKTTTGNYQYSYAYLYDDDGFLSDVQVSDTYNNKIKYKIKYQTLTKEQYDSIMNLRCTQFYKEHIIDYYFFLIQPYLNAFLAPIE